MSTETHADGCDGQCVRWIAANSPSCRPYPCVCPATRAAAPDWKQKLGTVACWWRDAVTGRVATRCACWSRKPWPGMPDDCCSLTTVTEPAGPPPEHILIRLTPEEEEQAGRKAIDRNAESRKSNRDHTRSVKRGAAEQMRDEERGPYGEAALAQYLGLQMDETINVFKERPHVGCADVRTIGEMRRMLLGRVKGDNADPDLDRPLVLALVIRDELPVVRLIGWATPRECANPHHGRQESWRGGADVFGLAHGFLHPMHTLPGAPAYYGTGRDDAAEEDPAEAWLGPAPVPLIAVGSPDREDEGLDWGGDPDAVERKPHVRRWTAAELTCTCVLPYRDDKKTAKVHCVDCHHDFANPQTFSVHRRNWTRPCREPSRIRDCVTGRPLLYMDGEGVWRDSYPSADDGVTEAAPLIAA